MKRSLANHLMSRVKRYQELNEKNDRPVREILITADDLIRKFNEQDGYCYWTAIPLNDKIKKGPWVTSVDRLDSDDSYHYDNVVLTFKWINLGKNRYDGDYREVIEEIIAALDESKSRVPMCRQKEKS